MKTYYLKTFWCQMNQADSEKIALVFSQAWYKRVFDIKESNIAIFNTCSVRQKWEDRVFWFVRDALKLRRKWQSIKVGITGCMVRKTGINEQYFEKQEKRDTPKKITYLHDEKGIFNDDDKLFPRIKELDFTLRIEEVSYLPYIFSHILWERFGQDDRFQDYFKLKQLRENPTSASVIIQTGCDNYCRYCIVPYTRGAEKSREKEEILSECREAISSWAKEIILLGQNVNSYGKQRKKELWDEKQSKWKWGKSLKIGIDIDDVIVKCWESCIIENYNLQYKKNFKHDDLKDFDFNGNLELKEAFFSFFEENYMHLKLFPWVQETLKKWKKQGHTLYIITSRQLDIKDGTLEYLENIFWSNFFEEIFFTHEHGEDKKYMLAQKVDLDVVIEDNPHQIVDYKKHENWKTLIFTQPRNKEEAVDNINHFRVHSWDEIDSLVEKFSFKSPFRELLEAINILPWIERIRFTSSNPHDMTRDILDAHFDLQYTCNYLHFALQSGSDAMLKKMNRKHTYKEFRDMVYYLRKRDPLFSISTDIIVGFSWETEAMFEETIKAFEECIFDFAYIARYSVRPWTLAAKLYPDDVDEKIKLERWHILNNLLKKTLQKRNELMIGRTEEVLIYGQNNNQFFGRTRNFKEIFFEKSSDLKIGDCTYVKIHSLDDWVLKGERK